MSKRLDRMAGARRVALGLAATAVALGDGPGGREMDAMPDTIRTLGMVVAHCESDLKSIEGRFPELAGFSRRPAEDRPMDLVFSGRERTRLDLRFKIRTADDPVATTPGEDGQALIRAKTLGYDLYSGFELSGQPTPGLVEELTRILARHVRVSDANQKFRWDARWFSARGGAPSGSR